MQLTMHDYNLLHLALKQHSANGKRLSEKIKEQMAAIRRIKKKRENGWLKQKLKLAADNTTACRV